MIRTSPLRILFTTALLSLFISEALLFLLQMLDYQRDMAIGLIGGLSGHALGMLSFHQAIGRDAKTFMLFGLGSIILRLFGLIILVFIVIVMAFLEAAPFIVGVLTSYFIGSWNEIAWLNRRSRRT